jgi:5-methylcytosine-specific restriction endonuclease McrA
VMFARRRVLHCSPFEERLPREGSRRWLVAELDRLVSVIVRRRDRRCVTCGEPRRLQCSHFYSRRYLRTRFELRNCNSMCAHCNRRHNEDLEPYSRFMQERYGAEVVAELEGLRDGRGKVTDEELREALGWLRTLA